MSDIYDRSGNKLPPGHTPNDGKIYDQNGFQTNKKSEPWQPMGGNSGNGGCLVTIFLLVGVWLMKSIFF